jgi:hypothetical protein
LLAGRCVLRYTVVIPRKQFGRCCGSLVGASPGVCGRDLVIGYLEFVTEVCRLCADFARGLEYERVFAIVGVMLIRTLIDRARRLTRPGLKGADPRRYTWTMDDLFSVPAGTVPQVDPEHGVDGGRFIPELENHRGKWVATNGRGIVAVRDTEPELLQALGAKRRRLRVYQVPATEHIAR